MAKVRVGSLYVYSPNLLDVIDGRTNLVEGDVVKVVNMHGCPPANTMGHCYVDAVASRKVYNGDFAGLVCCNSLVPLKKWQAGMKAAEKSAKRTIAILEFEKWRFSAVCKAIDRATELRWHHGSQSL